MRNLTKQEITTVLAGLRYLQANRDDAVEAMSDFNDASDISNEPFLLTEEKIDKLCEEINFSKEVMLS